jgi:dTDP-4-dehydrorhamnose reductase
MRILLIGGNGMLGYDVAEALGEDDLVRPSSQELDILDLEALRAGCRRVRPEVIISTTAFHRVDDAETDAANAFRMNAVATRNLALAAREFGARIAWISTDYVFDGTGSTAYEPSDTTHPINVYGASKAAGECLIRMTTSDHLIVRTSGLYGLHKSAVKRTNFVDSILRLLRTGREEISVVSDQVCTPTYTADFARTFVELIRSGAAGTFHITNTDKCSWAEFAEEIIRLVAYPTKVRRISSAEYAAVARRPAFSVLGHEALKAQGVALPRTWRDALPDFVRERARHGDVSM